MIRTAAFTMACLVGPQAFAAGTGPYAPLNRPGPALSVSQDQVNAALACTGNLGDPKQAAILLVPGTASTPQTNFSWNYERAFVQSGRPFCAITLPGNALLDIQTAGEYITGGIRTVFAASGNRRIKVVGYSQGGMVPRWALRFWPDTRRLVASVISLDPSNHGTLDAVASCDTTHSCAPANWQQASNSSFVAALNSGAETFFGIAYTVVYSDTDEVVFPNLPPASASSLHTGLGKIANISVQSICPNDTSEHLAMGTYDPVGYALVVDALDHKGPADAARIAAATCLQQVQPGVDKATFAQNLAAFTASIAAASNAAPTLGAEPALMSYVFR